MQAEVTSPRSFKRIASSKPRDFASSIANRGSRQLQDLIPVSGEVVLTRCGEIVSLKFSGTSRGLAVSIDRPVFFSPSQPQISLGDSSKNVIRARPLTRFAVSISFATDFDTGGSSNSEISIPSLPALSDN